MHSDMSHARRVCIRALGLSPGTGVPAPRLPAAQSHSAHSHRRGPSVATVHNAPVPYRALDRAIGDRSKVLRSRWSGDTYMQESIRVQIGHALEDLLHDRLDLFLVERYAAALRGSRTPLKDA